MDAKTSSRSVLPWVLGIGAIAVFGLELWYAESSLTQREVALFNSLEFLLSLAFAWAITRLQAQKEFRKNQRQFAIAAFRRVKEIDKGINRILERVNARIADLDGRGNRELDVVREITRGIRESIKSSVADWSDIIGEEIEAVEKIERIASEAQRTEKEPASGREPQSRQVEQHLSEIEETKSRLNELVESLPSSLRLMYEGEIPAFDRERKVAEELERQLEETGEIYLSGYWDGDFVRDIAELDVGDRLRVRVGEGEYNRGPSLIAYDEEGRSVGVVTNITDDLNYDDFMVGLLNWIRRSEFDLEITEINTEREGHHYFTGRLTTKRRELQFLAE